MKNLPTSEIYKQEFKYMPWGFLINKILAIIEKEAPVKGTLLDLMCGPGYLLNKIAKRRNDLILEGIDISEEFINYAKNNYSDINFQIVDSLLWKPTKKYDVILCTGGIHHLPYDKQNLFLKKIPPALNTNGFAIFADPYVNDYANELERKMAAAKLGYEYIIASIKNGATDDITKATIDILYNDVMGFEYKTSIKKLEPSFRKLFKHVEIIKTWPESESEFGDYYIMAKN